MNVLLIGDVHLRAHELELRLAYQFKDTGRVPDLIIQVGDFMYYPQGKPWPFESDPVQGVPKWFIRGNHEDHRALLALPGEGVRSTAYGDWQYVPDGHFQDGIFFIGGAWSIDRAYRQLGPFKWQEEEELTYAQQKEVWARLEEVADQVRLVVTHDAPGFLYPRFLTPPYNQPQGRTADFLWKVYNRLYSTGQPFSWVFGHHHRPLLFERERGQLVGLDLYTGGPLSPTVATWITLEDT